MIRRHDLLTGILLCSLSLLSACGEGWEIVQYDGVPYGEDRTVGSGIKFVRAHLLPEKGPVLTPMTQDVEDFWAEHLESIENAEPLFEKILKKGK